MEVVPLLTCPMFETISEEALVDDLPIISYQLTLSLHLPMRKRPFIYITIWKLQPPVAGIITVHSVANEIM